MEAIEDKSVFSFNNVNFGREITAVVARYGFPDDDYAETGVTCNFVLNAGENLDVGDFSQMHSRSAGTCWHERLTFFD